MGIGQLGMTEDVFWDTTPRAFFNAVEGFESLRRADLEVQRLQTLYMVNTWTSKKIMDPKKLWAYPWERVSLSDKERAMATQRARKLAEKFDRIEKRHGHK